MIISISGFGWSGSGAVYDILCEYSDCRKAFNDRTSSEFCILYDVDGIRDLEYNLVDNPCRIRSYVAIKRFLKLIDNYCCHFKTELSFGNHFKEYSEKYIKQLVDFEFTGTTYTELFEESFFQNQYNRFIAHLFGNRIVGNITSGLVEKLQKKNISQIRVSYRPDNFLEATNEYLNSLFLVLGKKDGYPIFFDQMVPADTPLPYLKYIDDIRVIVVRRDPRDMYLLAKCAYNSGIAIPVNTVDNFISFYKKIVASTIVNDNPDILNVQFEDLVYFYDTTIQKIETFLGITKHDSPKSKFNPAVSVNNTQLFKKYKGFEDDIRKIEEALPESLYSFEAAPVIESTTNKVF